MTMSFPHPLETQELPANPSWAEIERATNPRTKLSLLIDGNTKMLMRMRFQHVLYAKLFGKAAIFEYVKTTLLGQWNVFGKMVIFHMLNGFMLIRCEK